MCGIEPGDLAEARAMYALDPDGTKKTAIAEAVLHALIKKQDDAIFQRREILRRLSQNEDFGSCWPADQYKARGYVAELARIVNIKDSFTRIEREREREHTQRAAANEELIAARHAKRERLRDIKQRLVDLLTADIIPVFRGLEFEKTITDLFSESGLTIKEPFTVQSDKTGSIVEQVDGAIEVRGRTFLVECKCWKSNISRQELAPLLVSVYNPGNVGGIFISASEYTESALADARAALSQKTIVLLTVGSILACLEADSAIAKFLEDAIREVELSRNPLGMRSATA
jgi:restriction system protein